MAGSQTVTSWQALKMALIGATTALVAATIIAPPITTPAASAEITRRPQANGPDVIIIDGEIEPGDDKKFIEIARDVTQASVVLNSKGGYNETAIIIGRFIRLRNYETRVKNGAVCNSACTLVWLAGTFRHLDRYARPGFHSAATERRPPYERHERGNADRRDEKKATRSHATLAPGTNSIGETVTFRSASFSTKCASILM